MMYMTIKMVKTIMKAIMVLIYTIPLPSLAFTTVRMVPLSRQQTTSNQNRSCLMASTESTVEELMKNIYVFQDNSVEERSGESELIAVHGSDARQTLQERGWKEISMKFVSSLEELFPLPGDNDDEEDDDDTPVNEEMDLQLQKALMDFYETEEDRYETLKTLIENGASIKRTRSIHRAASDPRNGARNLNVLLQFGASLHSRDQYGSTPLHIAAVFSNADVIEILLDHGADLEAKDNDGLTPRMVFNKTVERYQDMEAEIGTSMPKDERQKLDRIQSMFS